MTVITLLTDFGTDDAYTGIMKGVILSAFPPAVIVDITHNIAPQDIIHAAYTIKSAYRFFPEGSVHTVVVDPGVGSDRAVIAFEKKGHIFLAPDNGVLSLVLEDDAADLNQNSLVSIENKKYFLEPVSRTFNGRDIFAPVAGNIARGVPINRLGPRINKKDIHRLVIEKPSISGSGELIGIIVSVDRFGNLVSNIDSKMLDEFIKTGSSEGLGIGIGGGLIRGLSRTYDDAVPQEPLAVIGSGGYLEISVNMGNAGEYFNAGTGDRVRLTAG